ncbi:cytochrome c [Cytophagaceae bacterium ABcell3]|nr:cytochrome c [Cytophagaceae bacterium ABcell3]
MKNLIKGKSLIVALMFIAGSFMISSCSSDDQQADKSPSAKSEAGESASVPEYGVGPVKEVSVSNPPDEALAEKGEAIFASKCSACHKMEGRYVGPAMDGVTERRNLAWIMNMILNPEEMTKKDPIAKKLLAEYMTQMVYQDVTEDEARAIVEYLRLNDTN